MALPGDSSNLTNIVDDVVEANVTDEERREYLDFLQDETTKTMIAAMTSLLLFAVVGVVGNSVVLYVYSRRFRRTSTRVFIIAIASFDLITNTVTIPGEIYDMFHIWDFDNPTLCRIRLFFNAFTTVSAAISLVAVAVVRYLKVCKPFGRQITVKQSKIISVVVVGIACLFAIPTAIINGRQTKPTPRPGIHGYECTIDDSFVDTIWPLVNTGLLLLLFLSCCIPLIVLYILIGIQAWKHSQLYGVTSAGKAGAATTVSYSSTSGPVTKSTDESCPTPNMRRKKIEEAAMRDTSDDESSKKSQNATEVPLIMFVKHDGHDDDNDVGVILTDVRRKEMEEAITRDGRDDEENDEGKNTIKVPLITVIKHDSDVDADAADADDEYDDDDDDGGDENDNNAMVTDDLAMEEAESQNLLNDESLSSEAIWQTSRLYVTSSGKSGTMGGKASSKSGSLLTCTGSLDDHVGEEQVPEMAESGLSISDHQCVGGDRSGENGGVAQEGEKSEKEERKAVQNDDDITQIDVDNPDQVLGLPGWPEDSSCHFSSKSQDGDASVLPMDRHGTGTLATERNQLVPESGSQNQKNPPMNESQREYNKDKIVHKAESFRQVDRLPNKDQALPGKGNMHNPHSTVGQGHSSSKSAIGGSDVDRTGSGKGKYLDLWRRLVRKKKDEKNEPRSAARPARRALSRTTAMLITITTVYIISLVPHLAMMFFKFTSPEQFAKLDTFGLSMYNLFLRFYFLNSAANAIIYNLCDKNFRKNCLELMRCAPCLR